jgi:hypothetical protein
VFVHGRGYQTSGFGPPLTPPIVQYLMIANLVVFGLQIAVPQVSEFGPVRPYYMWQAGHLWEPKKFLRFYLFCGIGAGFVIASWPYLVMNLTPQALLIPTVGASGAIYGVLLAYSLTWPDRVIALIFPPITFRAIWLIPGLFIMTVMFGGGGISHIGHLGGVLMGWLYLRRKGHAGAQSLSLGHLKYRWKRYRMRQKLRSVHYEEHEARRRRGGGDDDHRVH